MYPSFKTSVTFVLVYLQLVTNIAAELSTDVAGSSKREGGAVAMAIDMNGAGASDSKAEKKQNKHRKRVNVHPVLIEEVEKEPTHHVMKVVETALGTKYHPQNHGILHSGTGFDILGNLGHGGLLKSLARRIKEHKRASGNRPNGKRSASGDSSTLNRRGLSRRNQKRGESSESEETSGLRKKPELTEKLHSTVGSSGHEHADADQVLGSISRRSEEVVDESDDKDEEDDDDEDNDDDDDDDEDDQDQKSKKSKREKKHHKKDEKKNRDGSDQSSTSETTTTTDDISSSESGSTENSETTESASSSEASVDQSTPSEESTTTAIPVIKTTNTSPSCFLDTTTIEAVLKSTSEVMPGLSSMVVQLVENAANIKGQLTGNGLKSGNGNEGINLKVSEIFNTETTSKPVSGDSDDVTEHSGKTNSDTTTASSQSVTTVESKKGKKVRNEVIEIVGEDADDDEYYYVEDDEEDGVKYVVGNGKNMQVMEEFV